MKRSFFLYVSLFLLIFISLFAISCKMPSGISQISDSLEEAVSLSDNDVPVADSSTSPAVEKGARDSAAVCLIPSADGTVTYGNNLVTIDASHTKEGYVMVKYNGSVSKVKLQITGPDQTTYTYDLNQQFQVFPFASGSGRYDIAAYENIAGTQYSTTFQKTIDVSIENEFHPFLYPNQYVNFSQDSAVVKLGEELASSAGSDLDVVSNIYNYMINNITYDYDKASTVTSGYLPDPDSVLLSKKGICFDYAAVMASMLRSQRIPTRLEIGYAGEAYHAWISTYIKDVGWVNGIIEFDGKNWKLMDPTFASNTSERELKKFIGDGSNYHTKYMY